MKHYKHLFIAIFCILILGTPWMLSTQPRAVHTIDNIFSYINKNYNLGAVFFKQTITVNQLQNKYDTVSATKNKIRILIVPGHEPDFGGAEYGRIKERDMAVDLAKYLKGFFDNNSHYDVVVARDKDNWNAELYSYFINNWNNIVSFIQENKTNMTRLVNNGSVKRYENNIIHNNAPSDVATRLFAINKWSNENHIDIAIHIHFNDYPRNNASIPGEYNGLAIYVPEKQYSNSLTTKSIANAVFKRLSKYNAVSNLPNEDDGIVEEQDLIAIGSNNTSDAPSMLIEYGYIYEPQFNDEIVRDSTVKDLAFQTYLGIQDFFGSGNDVSLAYDTLMLPHKWNNIIDKNNADKNEVIALQTALTLQGVYPPYNKNKNDCPRTGKFGPCTLTALKLFQSKYGINNENDMVGEKTKKILNKLYSVQTI